MFSTRLWIRTLETEIDDPLRNKGALADSMEAPWLATAFASN